ncbi:BTAD domain-containing putative transcriptional regulator [Actinosynnema sp. ALI-1.44]|uniref:BTAD domain-containing putative transcriptional regulator n=1 Tax=Actinosynnema sp. ALI-1.44 TaxID=1933779 RepID=UPI00117736CD
MTTRASARIATREVTTTFTLLRKGLGLWRGEPLSDAPSYVRCSDIVPAPHELRLSSAPESSPSRKGSIAYLMR